MSATSITVPSIVLSDRKYRWRVLHVLDHSWPVLSGYSIRSRSIVSAQAALGCKVGVITGISHELDHPSRGDTEFEGVAYSRTLLPNGLRKKILLRRYPGLRETVLVEQLSRRILALLNAQDADIVHAHSPSLCGLAAWIAASQRHLPCVYEIRGFWEESAVSNQRLQPGSPMYHLRKWLEEFVTARVDAVVGIAENIIDDLRARGVPSEKLFHVPNGVDTNRFRPSGRDGTLASQLGLLPGIPVLGFFGSLWKFEGVSWLVRAATELHARGLQFHVLIAGHGEEAPEIATAIQQTRSSGYIHFVGRVENDQIPRYYSLADIMVYPRRKSRLTDRVTPLKPLEAMAYGIPVLASRVGGMQELIEDGRTGLLFDPDDLEDFVHRAEGLIADSQTRRRIGAQARQTMIQEKDWRVIAARYDQVYDFAQRHYRPQEASLSY